MPRKMSIKKIEKYDIEIFPGVIDGRVDKFVWATFKAGEYSIVKSVDTGCYVARSPMNEVQLEGKKITIVTREVVEIK